MCGSCSYCCIRPLPWDPVSAPPSADAVPTPYMPNHSSATITSGMASHIMTDRLPERSLIRAFILCLLMLILGLYRERFGVCYVFRR